MMKKSASSKVNNYLHKDWAATTNVICRSTDVGTVTLHHLFAADDSNQPTTSSANNRYCRRLLLPLFQRRFCWGESNWMKLYSDVLRVARDGGSHSLGRVVLYNEGDGAAAASGTMTVLDGQQRLTTCALLIAALRDCAVLLLPPSGNSNSDDGGGEATTIVQSANAALLQVVASSSMMTTPLTGDDADETDLSYWSQYADTATLLPTFNDRSAYLRAIMRFWTADDAIRSSSSPSSPVTRCKAAFMRAMLGDTTGGLVSFSRRFYGGDDANDRTGSSRMRRTVALVLSSILSGQTVLSFYLSNATDVQRMFTQLAAREAALAPGKWQRQCKGYAPGVVMSSADLVRNMIFSHLPDAKAQSTYQATWLKMESRMELDVRRQISTAETSDGDTAALETIGRVDKCLERFLFTFLVQHQPAEDGDKDDAAEAASGYSAALLGGQAMYPTLYPRFTAYMKSAVRRAEEASPAVSRERLCEEAAIEILRSLVAFANENSASAPWMMPGATAAQPPDPPRPGGGRKKRASGSSLRAFSEFAEDDKKT